jgi:hypothetical protein
MNEALTYPKGTEQYALLLGHARGNHHPYDDGCVACDRVLHSPHVIALASHSPGEGIDFYHADRQARREGIEPK